MQQVQGEQRLGRPDAPPSGDNFPAPAALLDGEEAQRELGSAFAELSRLVCRQLEEAAKTAPKHELATIQRFIIQERERGAAFLIREFREAQEAKHKRRKEAHRPRHPPPAGAAPLAPAP